MRGFADIFPDMPGSITEPVCWHAGGAKFSSRKPEAESHPFSFVLYIGFMASSPRSKKKAKPNVSSHSKVRLVSSRTVYRGPVFWVTTDEVQEPGGVRVRRDIIHHTGSVVVLAVDESRSTPRVLLERQYRHAAKDYLWELPAGRIDPGEMPLPAAQRELLEETGYTAEHWRRILNFYASPGFVAETMSVFLATGLRTGKAQPEDDEIILKRMISLPAAIRMVLKGTIRDAKTISSILWLDRQLLNKHDLNFSSASR
jgi:ADP-ribose pyrophosphatase